MKTKSIIAMLFVCLFVGISAGTFATEKQNRDIAYAFSKISVDNGINLYLSQGNAPSASIEADAAVLDKIEAVVQNETLIIKVKKGEKLKRNTVVNAHITAVVINQITADKKSNVYLQTPIHSDSYMGVYVHNGSSITCGAIKAKEVNFNISGTSKARLSTIAASTFTLNLSINSEVYEGTINTDFASVNLRSNSTANIAINAADLVSSAYNKSNLIIGGIAKNVTANASGGSHIKGSNLHFEKSTTKSLDSSNIKLAQK